MSAQHFHAIDANNGDKLHVCQLANRVSTALSRDTKSGDKLHVCQEANRVDTALS